MRLKRNSAHPTPRGRLTGGFTLIELMIVVTIMGILAAIAYPSYTQYVTRGKRSEGRAFLMDAAARQERRYSDNNQYTATIGAGGLGIGDPAQCTQAGVQSENCHYTLTITGVAGTNQDYTLTATPTFADAECGALTLNKAGVRTEGGTAANVNDCWGK